MSFYRCLFCGGKIEEYDEDDLIANYDPSKELIAESDWDIFYEYW